MDRRLIFVGFIAVLGFYVQAAPRHFRPIDIRVQGRSEISTGPLVLNEEDKNALIQATKPIEQEQRPLNRDEISHGPFALNDEDRKALLEVTKQVDQPGEEAKQKKVQQSTKETEHNEENPEEETDDYIASLTDCFKSAIKALKRIVGMAEN